MCRPLFEDDFFGFFRVILVDGDLDYYAAVLRLGNLTAIDCVVVDVRYFFLDIGHGR